jgi:hypothetical protein
VNARSGPPSIDTERQPRVHGPFTGFSDDVWTPPGSALDGVKIVRLVIVVAAIAAAAVAAVRLRNRGPHLAYGPRTEPDPRLPRVAAIIDGP